MMYPSVLVNIDEIWLKGKNRRFYLKQLKDNLQNSVSATHTGDFEVLTEGPKFFVNSSTGLTEKSLLAIANTAGVASLQPCRVCELSIEAIAQVALDELQTLNPRPYTLRVETKRTNKSFPMQSTEISRRISQFLFKNFQGMTGEMKNPDTTVSIRILNHHAYVATRKIVGVGGVPVGTSDKMLTLLSGGFDSPVASYLMFRRGVAQDLVFFHAAPFIGNEPKEKVLRIAKTLAQYQSYTHFYVIPFGSVQKLIAENCREDYRTLFFRIYMLRTSAQLAKKVGAKGLITGDALSQVSSQTMANISAVDRCVDMSVLRPVIAFNKLEILEWAKKAQTHDISIEPHDDACALFAPKHPIIRAHQSYCESFVEHHPFTEAIDQAIAEAEHFKISQSGELLAVKKTKKDITSENFLAF